MASRSNRSALNRTVASLRRAGKLAAEDAALVRLAEQLADRLDREIADPSSPTYAVSGLARTYFAVEEAIRASGPTDEPGDSFGKFLETLSTPGAGVGDEDLARFD